MPRTRNTFEKRRKEMERMRKAHEKREQRLARRSSSAETEEPAVREPGEGGDDDSSLSGG